MMGELPELLSVGDAVTSVTVVVFASYVGNQLFLWRKTFAENMEKLVQSLKEDMVKQRQEAKELADTLSTIRARLDELVAYQRSEFSPTDKYRGARRDI